MEERGYPVPKIGKNRLFIDLKIDFPAQFELPKSLKRNGTAPFLKRDFSPSPPNPQKGAKSPSKGGAEKGPFWPPFLESQNNSLFRGAIPF